MPAYTAVGWLLEERMDVPDATSWMGLAWVEGDESKLVKNFVSTVREVAGGKVSDLPNTDP
jgi:hypothetical protein